MKNLRPLAFVCLLLLSLASNAQEKRFFLFDQPDETFPATLLENSLYYDAGIACGEQGLWVSWLEFQPGKGDQLWVGLRGDNRWIINVPLSATPGDYANPTPTVDAKGHVWLTYESTNSTGGWDIFVREYQGKAAFAPAQRLSASSGPDIQHRVAADPKGGIWVVWQGDRDGQFDILAQHLPGGSPVLISDSRQNDWEPSATVTPDGVLHVVWDSYDGQSYNVLERSLKDGQLRPVRVLAGSPNFEAHAQIASDKAGKLWVCWEEDGPNWGKAYRSRTPGPAGKKSNLMTDLVGPLHRFRKLHVAELDEAKAELRQYSLPMPALELAQQRPDAPSGVKQLGAFYERGHLLVDPQNRPWLVYRHFYAPQLGIGTETHKQEDARLYARCLLPDGWSKLFCLEAGQGDGAQRLFVIPANNGLDLAWTTGRTDRRATHDTDLKRGVALGQIRSSDNAPKAAATLARTPVQIQKPSEKSRPTRPKVQFAGKDYELFYGDMHRHTDISLCFSPSDGTLDDAYRYGLDAAPLDFLGVTDHTHDLASGDQLSLIWWRTRKEVNRHYLAASFIPFYSYERSRKDTDHNVFSLRDDMLRPHGPPLPDFWQELDNDTFTIPHQPFNANTWKHKDNAHRPLLEIFQGFRNESMEDAAQVGLKQGHEMGFIAASDHLSTGVSFACVWAEKPERESVFRALQARRTFGATARIILKATCGEHWMGEKFSCEKPDPIQVEVTPTAPIAAIDLIVDGDLAQKRPGKGDTTLLKTSFQWNGSLQGKHIVYVRVKQTDGNMAWSSPFWIQIGEQTPNP